MRAPRRSACPARARLDLYPPVQGGTTGLLNAIWSGKVDPLDPRPMEADRFVDRTQSELRRARTKRKRRQREREKGDADRLPF